MTDETTFEADATAVVDATAEEISHTPPPQADTSPAVALTLRPSRDALMPIESEQVIASMQAYQQLLPRLLDPSDFQSAGTDKKGKERKFVKRSGWRKIARAFNLSLTIVDYRVERDASGQPIRAEAIVRAIAPNGQCQDGDGYCSADEERFQKEKGRQKLENDLRATAVTRAKSRAISDLVGMGDVSAEEVDAPGSAEASAELQESARIAMGYLLEGEVEAVDNLSALIKEWFDGRMPAAALQGICLAAKAVKDKDARDATAAAATPDEEPS